MASIISAGTTSATSLNLSADTTGILQLATNNGTVAVTVTTAQKFGFGTTSPNGTIDVKGNAIWVSTPSGTSDSALIFSHDGTGGVIQTSYNTSGSYTPLFFRTSEAERMKIATGANGGGIIVADSSQSTAPYSTQLYVNGSIAARNGGVDGSFSNAFVAGYTSNYNEQNIIQSAVSSGGTGSGFRFKASNGAGSSSTTTVLDLARTQIIFYTDGSESARFTTGGEFAIGKTQASESYTTGSGYGFASPNNDPFFSVVNVKATGSNSCIYLNKRNSNATNGLMSFMTNNGSTQTSVGSITHNGSNTSFNTSSDYRLKENIAPMIDALAKVAQLKPCTYSWKATGVAGQGFIAHELQEVLPDAVVGEKDAVEEDGSIKPQGIDTSYLVATLTAAIQELNAKVTALENK